MDTGSINVEAMRVTKLLPSGKPDATVANVVDLLLNKNAMVTSDVQKVEIQPVVEDGEDQKSKRGNGIYCMTYKGPDNPERYTIDIESCKMNPELFAIMLNASIIVQPPVNAANYTAQTGIATFGGTVGTDVIGFNFPSPNNCAPSSNYGVAVEFWSLAWSCDAQASAPYSVKKYVFPKVIFKLKDWSLENDFVVASLEGYTVGNPAWGYGPWPGYFAPTTPAPTLFTGTSDQPIPVTSANSHGFQHDTGYIPTVSATRIPVPGSY